MASKGKPKRASPKVRKTAELYKSSHNIGNRTARMRVGCYKDTEFAVEYPDGFWDPVKPTDQTPDRSRGASENHSPTRVSSPASVGKKTSPQKASKSASGATKRKLEDKQEMNGSIAPTKKATPKDEKKTPKLEKGDSKNEKKTVKSEKNYSKKDKKGDSEKTTPKHGKTGKNDSNIKPTKEVKIVLEKHPTPKIHDEKKVADNKGKANQEKDKKEKKEKEKKISKEINSVKDKNVTKDKKEKDKTKIKGASKKEIKKDKKKKAAAKTAEEKSSDEKSEHSSDYTYDSNDSEMEISFKKRKTETPVKPSSKESLKSKVKGGKKMMPKGKDSKSNNTGSKIKKSNSSSKVEVLEPRAPRIKRTACLNANAIVSALYQTEDTSSNTKSSTSANRSTSPAAGSAHKTAANTTTTSATASKHSHSSRASSPAAAAKHSQPKRRRMTIEADLDEGGDEAFDLYLEEYQQLGREAPNKAPKSGKRPPTSPKKETSSSHKEPSSPKKVASPKKETSKKRGE